MDREQKLAEALTYVRDALVRINDGRLIVLAAEFDNKGALYELADELADIWNVVSEQVGDN